MLSSFLGFVFRQVFRLAKAFLKVVFQCLLWGFVSLFLVSTLIGLLNRKQESAVEPGTILILDLSDPIVEVDKGLRQFRPHSMKLMDCIQGLEAAAEDERIAGLIIRAESLSSSTLNEVLKDELWQSVAAFKAKKPVLAYLRETHRQDYTLASIAHKVYMHPLGHMSILGTGCEVVFWGTAFQKYGLKANVFKCGRYKSATEPFTEERMSPESREQLSSFLQEVWQHSVDTISKARNITPQTLDTLSKKEGIIDAKRALELKLIDAIAHEDELGTYFEKAVFIEQIQDYKKLSLKHYAQGHKKETLSADTIAILYADGVISNQKGDWENLNSTALIKDLRKLRAKDSVRAIVMRINSPGGEASASEDLRREIELTNAVKPVIISMGSYAASGGYWAALGASTIFANPSTLTGSIGAFAMLIDWENLGIKHGIRADRVATSPLASIYSSSRSKNEEEGRILQSMTDTTYELFIDHVAKSRKMDLSAVEALAQGRIWSGSQAFRLGLVDHLGTLKDALSYAAQGLDSWQIEEYPKEKTYRELVKDLWKGEGYVLSYGLSLLPHSLQRLIYTYCYEPSSTVFTLLDYDLKACF
jgi:protease IV